MTPEVARDRLNRALASVGIAQRAFLSGRYRPERVILVLSTEAATQLQQQLDPRVVTP